MLYFPWWATLLRSRPIVPVDGVSNTISGNSRGRWGAIPHGGGIPRYGRFARRAARRKIIENEIRDGFVKTRSLRYEARAKLQRLLSTQSAFAPYRW